VHVVGGAHNDGLMTLLLMFGVTALLRERSVAGGAAVVAATAAKLSAAAITPFALIGAANRRSLLLGAAFATAAIAVATASVFNSHALDSISLAAQNQADTSRYSIPATFSRIADVDEGTVRAVALVAYGAGLIWLLVWTARGGDWVRASGWAALGTLLATAWLLPWYVIWVLPLAAISRDRKLTAAVLVLTAFQLLNRVPL
jgi:alpha-1,6-mannosyltransferase